MNKVILTGNLVREPELQQSAGGKNVTSNSIAVRRDMKDENGEYPTDFVNFVAWGQQAEYIATYGHKGDRMELCGRWQTRTFTDRNGNNRRADECIVEHVTIFSRQEPQKAPAAERGSATAPAPAKTESGTQLAAPMMKPRPAQTPKTIDDDLPF